MSAPLQASMVLEGSGKTRLTNQEPQKAADRHSQSAQGECTEEKTRTQSFSSHTCFSHVWYFKNEDIYSTRKEIIGFTLTTIRVRECGMSFLRQKQEEVEEEYWSRAKFMWNKIFLQLCSFKVHCLFPGTYCLNRGCHRSSSHPTIDTSRRLITSHRCH